MAFSVTRSARRPGCWLGSLPVQAIKRGSESLRGRVGLPDGTGVRQHHGLVVRTTAPGGTSSRVSEALAIGDRRAAIASMLAEGSP